MVIGGDVMKGEKYFLGIVLVIVGVLGVLKRGFNIDIISILNFWPLLVLMIGISCEYSYFSRRKSPELLVPGGILTTIGLLFIFELMTNWRFSGYTWGIYTLAVAIGLFQLYIFGGKEKGLLIPVVILTLVSLRSLGGMVWTTLFGWIGTSIIFPLSILILGVYIIIKKKR